MEMLQGTGRKDGLLTLEICQWESEKKIKRNNHFPCKNNQKTTFSELNAICKLKQQ